LNAQTFRDITGGTTEEVKVVSKDDLTKLEEAISESLQETLFSELEALIGDGEVKLEGSEQTSEPKITPSKNAEDKADSVDMTIEITASFFVVQEDDLTEIANFLIGEKQDLEGEFEIKDLADLKLGPATMTGETAKFNLRLEGNIKASLSEQTIKDTIKGKVYAKAIQDVKNLPDVKEVTVTSFTPWWVPVKRMPTNDNRITVNIK
jgi:hypothetical protein